MFEVIISVVINEVMYNPLGSESAEGLYNEAVEVLNPSDTTVCLSGWLIKDKYDADMIVEYPDSSILTSCPGCVISTCVPPHGFGVILDRDYTNPSSPNPTPYSFPSGTIVMSVNDAQIGNGLSQEDSLFLINSYGDTVDAVGNFPVAGDGISVERKSPQIKIFLTSRGPHGHTLGYSNSVSCLYEFSISVDNIFDFKDSVKVLFSIKNDGTEISNFRGKMMFDANLLKYIDTVIIPESTITVAQTFVFSSSSTHELALIMDTLDCDTSNNSQYIQYTYQNPTLLINEINYKGTEWVEIYNVGGWSFNFNNFKVCDGSSCSGNLYGRLEPGGYMVITGDTNFKALFPEVEYKFLSPMPKFNNSGDDVILKSHDIVVDSLHYLSSFGGGHNISLERISPYINTNEPSNWGTTQDPRGGTPGRENSLSFIGSAKGVSLSREIYRIGEKILLSFSYDFKVSKITVNIYDDMGILVKEEVFRPNSTKGQIAISTDNMWKGLYFMSLRVEGDRSVILRKRFALRP